VGTNGSVWNTDNGETFTQIEEASGFRSIATNDIGDAVGMSASAVGTNGTLWEYSVPPLH
jgi:hypothetical protein